MHVLHVLLHRAAQVAYLIYLHSTAQHIVIVTSHWLKLIQLWWCLISETLYGITMSVGHSSTLFTSCSWFPLIVIEGGHIACTVINEVSQNTPGELYTHSHQTVCLITVSMELPRGVLGTLFNDCECRAPQKGFGTSFFYSACMGGFISGWTLCLLLNHSWSWQNNRTFNILLLISMEN